MIATTLSGPMAAAMIPPASVVKTVTPRAAPSAVIYNDKVHQLIVD